MEAVDRREEELRREQRVAALPPGPNDRGFNCLLVYVSVGLVVIVLIVTFVWAQHKAMQVQQLNPQSLEAENRASVVVGEREKAKSRVAELSVDNQEKPAVARS